MQTDLSHQRTNGGGICRIAWKRSDKGGDRDGRLGADYGVDEMINYSISEWESVFPMRSIPATIARNDSPAPL